jgi:hypothetical protein
LVGLFVFTLSLLAHAADTPPALTVNRSGAFLHAQHDTESDKIARLEKGEALVPVAEAVGLATWYLVRTKQGVTGWVRATDVTVSDQLKEAFRTQHESTWTARTSTGRVFEGAWSVDPASAKDKASGTWTLRDGAAKIVMRGAWSAQKFSTGWNGTWRAVVDGRKGEYAGSWTADFSQAREGVFAELFEAAARDAIRGVWSAGGNSGSWTIRVMN